MVISCCAVGCTNRQGCDGKSLFAFPKYKEQRDRWIAAVNRKMGPESVLKSVQAAAIILSVVSLIFVHSYDCFY